MSSATEVLGKKFEQFERNEHYFTKEFNLIRKNYPDAYVGVTNGKVGYHDKSLDHLLKRVRDDGKSMDDVFVVFVPSKRVTLVV